MRRCDRVLLTTLCLATVMLAARSGPVLGQDQKSDRKPDQKSPSAAPATPPAQPAAQDTSAEPAQPAAGAQSVLEEITRRLNRVERELEELRSRAGKIPVDKKDQKVVALIESPHLGSVYYGSATNVRFLATKLLLVNLTDKSFKLTPADVQLVADGQDYPVKEPKQQYQFHSFQHGQQSLQLKNLQMPAEVPLTAGGTASTWLLFPELPAGNHVPKLVIKIKLGEETREIDVNALQRDVLALTVDRIGPRGSLAVLKIGGILNTINAGALVDELDRLTGDKVVRFVVTWAENASILDQPLTGWLQTSAMMAGQAQLNQQQFPFPSVPVTIRELHLAAMPGLNANTINQAAQNNPAAGGPRLHLTDSDAVIAALRTAYESLPRDELFLAIQNGQRLERAAALHGGGGRLGADKLPTLLKLADDNDPLIQQAALAALSHFGEQAAVDKLIEYVRKNVQPLSETAIASLAGSRFSTAHEALLALLNNEEPASKKNIVKILARYPRPIWSETIFQFVKDPRAGLNTEALAALVEIGHPQLVSVLSDVLKGNDANFKQQAFNILVNRTDRESEEVAVTYLLEEIKSKPATQPMLTLLNRVKDKRALPLLMAQFDASPIKTNLIQTLAIIGDQETAVLLSEKYPRLQANEKGEALRALKRLNAPGYRELASQALQSNEHALVGFAVQGLQEDGSPEAIKMLIDALDASTSSQAWSYLTNALSVIGTPAARAALVRARDSGNPQKRNYAVNGLTQLRQRSPGYQYIFQAQAFVQMEKWKEALEQFDLAIQLDPQLPDAYSERANVYLKQEKFAEAGKDYAKAYELDPYNSQALTGMGITMVVVDGKHVEAVKLLEESRSRFANNALFSYNAACVYGRAVEYLQKNEKAADRDKLLPQYTETALSDLRKSIEQGFQDFDWMKKDPDLKSLQELPEFKKLSETKKPDAAAVPRAQRVRVRGL